MIRRLTRLSSRGGQVLSISPNFDNTYGVLDAIGSSEILEQPLSSNQTDTADEVQLPLIKRIKTSKWLASFLGICLAFLIVLIWFPKSQSMWTLPIQEIDAPSHYYFIRKLMRNGVSAALALNPNGSFYPPLFHLLVYALISISSMFGSGLNIFASLNIVWIVASGLIFPAGMALWCSYFLQKSRGWGKEVISFLVPVLSVSSAAFPFWLLRAGPLIAYGFASCILPFLLYGSLRLMDLLTGVDPGRSRALVRWILIDLALFLMICFAQPRVAFTYLVLVGFFALIKLPRKFLLFILALVLAAGGLFGAYVMYRDPGKNYFHPSTWFHTFQPTRSLSGALGIVIGDGMSGLAGVSMGLMVCLALFSSLFLSEERKWLGAALVLTFLLVGLIFVCSASLTGPIANLLTAAWYRGETRTVSMIPFAVVPLLAFGTDCLLVNGPDLLRRTIPSVDCAAERLMPWVLSSLMVILVLSANFSNPIRIEMAGQIADTTRLFSSTQGAQLTTQKKQVLDDLATRIEPDAVVISDPMNGSMYGMTLNGTNMLYPVYNPMHTKHGVIFGQVEEAFASGDRNILLDRACPVQTNYAPESPRSAPTSVYFLAMGDQADSLLMFTYKDQYLPFHDQSIIDRYVNQGALKLIRDYSDGDSAKINWALYRLACR